MGQADIWVPGGGGGGKEEAEGSVPGENWGLNKYLQATGR